jgi:hypothetical protein
MSIAMKLILAMFIALIGLLLTGCAGFRISGGIQTDYGSITSDGKSVTILADARTSGLSK